MMLERVLRYAPEMEKRCHPQLNTTSYSLRMDETSVKIKKPECDSTKPWIQKARFLFLQYSMHYEHTSDYEKGLPHPSFFR